MKHCAASPSPRRDQHVTPTKQPHGSSPGATECLCPTCQYYKAVYLYHQECQSPNMDAFSMYPYSFYPMNPLNAMMNPLLSMMSAVDPAATMAMMNMAVAAAMATNGCSPTNGLAVSDYEAANSAPVTSVSVGQAANTGSATGNSGSIEQFHRSVGNLANIACTASGRTMLQYIMRLQHLDKIHQIFEEILADCATVMLDTHGCHVVRSLLEVLDGEQVGLLMEKLTPTLILNMCTSTQYTRRILQTLFERHSNRDLQMVVDVVASNAQYLAATQQGCICWMRVFEHCSSEQKAQMVATLTPTFPDLACDPFGNYVVQCAFEHSEPHVSAEYVVKLFAGKLLKLSCNKFASNVMEKAVRIDSPVVRRIVLDELIYNPAALQQMVQDGFGNFVIQSIIETSSQPAELKKICDRLRPVIPQSPYGHKIDAKIRGKRLPQGLHPAGVNTHRRQGSPLAAF